MAYISRDPFARTELHRQNVYVSADASCAWCGRVRATCKGRQYLYQYRTESDGGRVSPHGRLFCDKSCHDSYYS